MDNNSNQQTNNTIGKPWSVYYHVWDASANKQTPTNKWKKEYESLLENPKWENKRQKILNRDKHKCVYCGSDIILQVHHKYYEKYPDGTHPKPWDYPDDALVTVCKNCHEEIHAAKKIKSYYRKKGKHYEKS